MSKPAYIYCITNLVDGKKYVGKTNSPRRRWRDHKNSCIDAESTQYDKLLYRAMRKHGVENFTFELMQEYQFDKEALDDEDNWIEKLQSRHTQHGYNITRGGAGPDLRLLKRKKRTGIRHTEKAKKKMSKSRTETHDKHREPFLPLLKELHGKGLTNVDIVKETGLAVATVRMWLRRLGLRSNAFKRPVSEAVPEILSLTKSGLNVAEISKIVKVRKTNVRKVLIENGIRPNRHRMGVEKGRVNPAFEAKKLTAIPIIIELRKQGVPTKKIRKHVGMGAEFVRNVLKEHGLSDSIRWKKSK